MGITVLDVWKSIGAGDLLEDTETISCGLKGKVVVAVYVSVN